MTTGGSPHATLARRPPLEWRCPRKGAGENRTSDCTDQTQRRREAPPASVTMPFPPRRSRPGRLRPQRRCICKVTMDSLRASRSSRAARRFAFGAHAVALLAAAMVFAMAASAVVPRAPAPTLPLLSTIGASKPSAIPTRLKKVDVKQGNEALTTTSRGVVVHYTRRLLDATAPASRGARFDTPFVRGVP